MATVIDRTLRRMAKVRRNVRRAAGDRARLSVFRSSKHIYAQVIDDELQRARGRDARVQDPRARREGPAMSHVVETTRATR